MVGTDPSVFDDRRYDPNVVSAHLDLIQKRNPDSEVFVLSDMAVPYLTRPVFDCRRNRFFQNFQPEKIEGSIFYCVFDSDELAINVVGFIADHKGIFYAPPIACPVASYFHFNDIARNVLKNELEDQTREGFAKWDCGPGDMTNLIQCIDLTRNVEGAFVEVGTFRGSSGRLALRYMQTLGISRACYFLDTYSGFDYQEAQQSADRFWVGTHYTEGGQAVENRFRMYTNESRGLVAKIVTTNIITESLRPEISNIALANIDVDMYEAVQAALKKIAPLIVQNGIMVVEDAGHTPALIGARVALNRFLKSPDAAAFIPIYMESGQTLLIRK
jgi:Macrocin-O-methyltransferase (TylF)